MATGHLGRKTVELLFGEVNAIHSDSDTASSDRTPTQIAERC